MTVETIKYQGKDYALVPARLKKFREENPRALIDTNPTYNEDGSVTFKAKIVKDRSDEFSAVGTGNARYSATEINRPKAFEKLETIAVGRALANIGYLNDGQIATTEELEEFYGFKADKLKEEIDNAKTVKELLAIFKQMDSATKKEFTEILGKKRKELENATNKEV